MAAQGLKGGGWRKCCKIQRVAVKDARLGGGTYIHRVAAGLRRKSYAVALLQQYSYGSRMEVG